MTQSLRGPGAIEANYRVLQAMVDRAARIASRGEYEAAAVCTQAAAEFASRNHPGTFVSPRMESLLREIAREAAGDEEVRAPAEPRRPDRPARVLHVLSQAHSKGGHTRLAWRWIANDSRRVHSVALIDQGRIPLPPELLDAVGRSGGELRRIDGVSPRLLARARALREAARSSEYVVLHVHPFDVVPVLAFAPMANRPKVLFMNHADHLFWVGAELVDRMLLFRETGRALSVERRSMPPDRCSIVPIPVNLPVRARSPGDAKAALGIERDSVLCLTLAFSYKFGAAGGVHLTDLVAPVFAGDSRARLIAIGPSHVGPWKQAHAAHHGRIAAIGERSDIRPWLEAADIFLMPMPVASTTAALEAASYGLPILELQEAALAASVLDSGSPGLSARAVIRATDGDAYRSKLRQLLADPALRAEAGAAARGGVLEDHAGAGWQAHVEEAFASAERCARREAISGAEPKPQSTPTDIRLCGMRPGLLARLGFILARQSKSLPLRWRLNLFFSRPGFAGAFPSRYFPLELALVLTPRRQMEWLRSAFDGTGWFRRYFDK